MNHTEPKCVEIIYLIFLADTNKIRRIGICTEALTSFQLNNKLSVSYTLMIPYTCIAPLEILGLLSQCASDLAFY